VVVITAEISHVMDGKFRRLAAFDGFVSYAMALFIADVGHFVTQAKD
jgi:hypothetical protein